MAFESDKAIKDAFWQTVTDRNIQIPYCTACKKFFFYPRPVCPDCWSEAVELRPVSGKGKIWSYTVVRLEHGGHSVWHERIPYAVALVELEEGARMMANVIDCDVDQVRSGLPVQLTYIDIGDRTLPAFHLES